MQQVFKSLLFHIVLDGTFQKELNADNPLGMGGKLAVSFAQLMKVLWSGKHYSYAPAKLKVMHIIDKYIIKWVTLRFPPSRIKEKHVKILTWEVMKKACKMGKNNKILEIKIF